MNEIFGAPNFISQLVWDKTRKNDAKLFSVGHEYLVIYANSLSMLREIKTKWREPKPGADIILAKYRELKKRHRKSYKAMEQELRKWYKSLPKGDPAKALSRHKHIDKKGVWRDRDISWPGGGGPRYDVFHPETKKPCKVPERGWGFATPESMQREIELDFVEFRKDHTEPPMRKAYLFPVDEKTGEPIASEVVGAQVMPSIIYKQAQVAVKHLRNLFGGKKLFDNPKDREVIARLIKYVTGDDDIILDSFAGSGTTGHAILQLNKELGSARKFVLVELEESICQKITHRRLKKAIKGYEYKTEKMSQIKVEGLGGGFHYVTLGVSLFDEAGNIRKDVAFVDLAAHVFFTETGEPLARPAKANSTYIGIHNGVAIYLLYNGILGDKRVNGGNVLTGPILQKLKPHDGPKVIYGEGCRFSEARLRRENIVFKQIPYEIKVN